MKKEELKKLETGIEKLIKALSLNEALFNPEVFIRLVRFRSKLKNLLNQNLLEKN